MVKQQTEETGDKRCASLLALKKTTEIKRVKNHRTAMEVTTVCPCQCEAEKKRVFAADSHQPEGNQKGIINKKNRSAASGKKQSTLQNAKKKALLCFFSAYKRSFRGQKRAGSNVLRTK